MEKTACRDIYRFLDTAQDLFFLVLVFLTALSPEPFKKIGTGKLCIPPDIFAFVDLKKEIGTGKLCIPPDISAFVDLKTCVESTHRIISGSDMSGSGIW